MTTPEHREKRGVRAAEGEGERETKRGGDGRASDRHRLPELPSISLPKGGGAIRGIGETFQANAATGTATLNVPISVSPGRSGFGPALSLAYDSGSGNGPYGLGWSLSVASVRRKTDKGLPRYADHEDSDTFILAGAEDLVPALRVDAGWQRDVVIDGPLTITRYRPRIESAFTRIERIEGGPDGVFWRTITGDNITTTYGSTADSRIADPADPSRVFEWLVDRAHDDRGNAIIYEYAAEDLDGVPMALHEQHRRTIVPPANRYPKRIRYGNRAPLAPVDPLPADDQWLFCVVFDYGEHDLEAPKITADPGVAWPARVDPFSTYRAGFDVRTYRLCRRILMFHRFDELGDDAVLVRSTDLTYDANRAHTFLRSVRHSGYVRAGDGYTRKSMPEVELFYTAPAWDATVHIVSAGDAEGAPRGIDGVYYRFVDLDGEGLAGVLTEQGGTWWYKRNDGGGTFAPPHRVERLPSIAHLASPSQQLLDLDGGGRLALVDYSGPAPGFFERTADAQWKPFEAFRSLPRIDWEDDNLRFVDLDGDGRADVLITEHDVITWYPSLANDGFDRAREVRKPVDEERGARVVFADGTQSIQLADMSGDGLQDLVRIRNGEVCYWPNQGHGRFGAKVTMSAAPRLDAPDLFDQRRVRLADIDGSGTTDLVYLRPGIAEIYINEAGNSFAAPRVISMPPIDSVATVTVADLLGTGTSAIVWSSPLPAHGATWRYIDLLGGAKPHLLQLMRNNLGAETRVEYAPSTRFYLEDRRAGRPWATKLPFVVQVVERVIVADLPGGHRLTTRYAYHHGAFDGVEREFRGFGCVEEVRQESFPGALDPIEPPPERIATWFHTGMWVERGTLESAFRGEYWNEDPAAWRLADPALPAGLTAAEQREAVRALRGKPMRREEYSDDGSPLSSRPYDVTETTYHVRLEQPQQSQRHASFFVHEAETLASHYERTLDDPRIDHSLVLDIDPYGNATAEAGVVYPRRTPQVPAVDEQSLTRILYTTHQLSNHEDTDWRRIGIPTGSRRYELHRPPIGGRPFTIQELRDSFAGADDVDDPPAPNVTAKRLLAANRALFWNDDVTGTLPLGDPGRRALIRETYRATFTPAIVAAVYGARVNDALLENDGGYMKWQGDVDGVWWGRSGVQEVDAAKFFLPVAHVDPWGNRNSIDYDDYSLLVVAAHDALPVPLRNTITATNHYRTLQPWRVVDPNQNRRAVRFDALGMVIATATIDKAGNGDTLNEAATEPDPADDPTAKLTYDLDAWRVNGSPCFVRAEAREKHGAANPRWQISYTYSDASGREILRKTQAEPGLAAERDGNGVIIRGGNGKPVLKHTATRWVGLARLTLNDEGSPVERFEPYFAPDERFETADDLAEWGVRAVLHYDPLNRVVRTDNANGTFTLVVFAAWERASWDENDTVLESQWHLDRAGLGPGDPEKRADTLATAHAATPGRSFFDSHGNPAVIVHQSDAATEHLVRTAHDIERRQTSIIDPRGVEIVRQRFDLAGHTIRHENADSGDLRTLFDAEEKTILTWHGSGADERRTELVHDEIGRLTQRRIKAGAAPEFTAERIVYGEGHADDARNLRLEIFRVYDGAGVATNERFDFKRNVTEASRAFTIDFGERAEWQVLAPHQSVAAIEGAAAPLLLGETWTSRYEYDALNRLTKATRADGSIVEPTWNLANLLDATSVQIGGPGVATELIKNIDYDAKGQRARVVCGSDVATDYTYDPLTDRLRRAVTNRPVSPGITAAKLLDLQYTYDPTGNIVAIRDDAEPAVYFDNAVVEPHALYKYDAMYRLTFAEGRELAANAAGAQPDQDQIPRQKLPHANDANAVRRYEQDFEYDLAGNLTRVRHRSGGGDFWTRRYAYAASGNRLLSTSRPGDGPAPPFSATYDYDTFGNMTQLPGIIGLTWNERGQLEVVDLGGGGKAHYTYDRGGRRARKVIERIDGSTDERLYLDGVEIYRERDNVGDLQFRRDTVHVMERDRRVALIETKKVEGGVPVAAQPVLRYQLDNHLGSALLETDEKGRALSYEEYFPYGETAYHSAQGAAETSLKRYRYNGKERDSETGLYDYGLRYYIPWLGRWSSADPAGTADGLNLYAYCRGNPIRFLDKQGTKGDEDKQKRPAGKAPAKAPAPAKPPAPKWEGSNVLVSKNIFKALQQGLGEAGKHIHFGKAPKTLDLEKVDGKKEKVALPSDYGVLQIDPAFVPSAQEAHLYGLLKAVIASGERVIVAFPKGVTIEIGLHVKGKPPEVMTDILRNTAQTFPSSDLLKKVNGGVVLKPGEKLQLTSAYTNMSVLYLRGGMATVKTVFHELLGHFYLASQHKPFEHSDSLKGAGITDQTGKAFEGTVLEFIDNVVLKQVEDNVKAGKQKKP